MHNLPGTTIGMEREPLITGQIDLLLLAVLAAEPAHGYAIIERLRERSGGTFDLPEGTIYPALYRLERAGYLTSSAHKVGGRERRTYKLTRAGKDALCRREEAWRRIVTSIEAVLRGPEVQRG
jgi:PadR family transcriptional regulator, regulatory protein PadR